MENRDTINRIESIARIGSYEWDLGSGRRTGSPNFLKMFGLPDKKNFSEKEFQAFIHPEDLEAVQSHLLAFRVNPTDFTCEYRCIHQPKGTIHIINTCQAFFSRDGVFVKGYGIVQDITATKLLERKLMALRDLNERKNNILKIVAHDLRAPISHFRMLTEMMQAEFKHKGSEYLGLQGDLCNYCEEIITELMEMSELEGVGQPVRFESCDINQIIRNSLKIFGFQAGKRSIFLKNNLCEEGKIKGSRKKLRRALDNLLSNAIKFTPGGKSIEVKTSSNNEKIVITDADEGIGIPPSYLDSLFKQHSKNIRRTGLGGERSTGLGLSIVKQIVDIHNGTIQVNSKEGQGTVFTIELPKNGYGTTADRLNAS